MLKQKSNPVKPHRQIIFFVGGEKRTIDNVIRVWENEMVHLVTIEGYEWLINKKNVLCVKKVYDPVFEV